MLQGFGYLGLHRLDRNPHFPGNFLISLPFLPTFADVYKRQGMCILLPKDPAHRPSVSVFESQVGMLYPSTSQQE